GGAVFAHDLLKRILLLVSTEFGLLVAAVQQPVLLAIPFLQQLGAGLGVDERAGLRAEGGRYGHRGTPFGLGRSKEPLEVGFEILWPDGRKRRGGLASRRAEISLLRGGGGERHEAGGQREDRAACAVPEVQRPMHSYSVAESDHDVKAA